MGLMTLSEMREDIYVGMAQRNEINPATASGKALLNFRIRDAYRHVCSPLVYDHPVLHNLQEDFVLGSGTPEGQNTESFTLPARLRALELVRNETNGYVHDPDRFDQFMNRGAAGQTFSRRGMRLYVPTSGSTTGHTLRVHYWGRPLDLSLDGDVTEVGSEWDGIITRLAMAFSFGWLRETALADYHQSIAAQLINDQVAEGALEAKMSGWQNDLSDTDPYQSRS